MDRWKGLSYGPQRRQSAAEAGALPAIVKVMRHHVERPAVISTCCLCIGNIVAGMDEAGVARKQLAADAGAIESIVHGLQSLVAESTVVEYGSFALGNICFAADAAGLSRKQRAADACAISAIVQGMRTHTADAAVAEYGSFALGNIARAVGGKDGGTDEDGKGRKEAAVDAGALGVVVNAMRFHGKESGVIEWGSRCLSNITYGSNEWREKAKQAGARPQWLVGMADAMEEIEKHRGGGSSKTERLAIRAPAPKATNTARPTTSSASSSASGGASSGKRVPRVPPKAAGNPGGAGGMVRLPDAGPLWR